LKIFGGTESRLMKAENRIIIEVNDEKRKNEKHIAEFQYKRKIGE
jgi:hypothetical protein